MPGNTQETKPKIQGHTLVACCAIETGGTLVPNSGFNVASVNFVAGPGWTITFANALPSAVFYIRGWHSKAGFSFSSTPTKTTASVSFASGADNVVAGERLFVEIWQ